MCGVKLDGLCAVAGPGMFLASPLPAFDSAFEKLYIFVGEIGPSVSLFADGDDVRKRFGDEGN